MFLPRTSNNQWSVKTSKRDLEFTEKKNWQKKKMFWLKIRNETYPWVVYRFPFFPYLIIVSTCCSMSANVMLVAGIFTTYLKMAYLNLVFNYYIKFCNHLTARLLSKKRMLFCCLFHSVCKIGHFFALFMIKTLP